MCEAVRGEVEECECCEVACAASHLCSGDGKYCTHGEQLCRECCSDTLAQHIGREF